MKSADIREKFLSFFESKGCERWPSSSLVPDDPSMLLTSAGMVQFKPYFLGLKSIDAIGTTTCQKCVRTTDIEVIGTTGRHLSFFEMLGNFSFGDYDKRTASEWAYEFVIDHLELPLDKLYFTIFEDDDEAYQIWLDIGIDPDRIVRLGEEDNFWAAGPTGPCGPCSEIYYDQGPEVGCGSKDCAPGCDCDRYLEFWNLVFTEYNRQEDGTLVELPRKNIDTGMGLERIAAIMQGVSTNYETDILRNLVGVAEKLSGVSYGSDEKIDLSLRIVADHSRAVTFLIADGILPSNEGRGYVLRRLLRRASRHGHLLGIKGAFLNTLVDEVIVEMGDTYSELIENKALIKGIVESEENRFQETLRKGLTYLDDALGQLSEGDMLDGVVAFTLHDTYGFPMELTQEIALERGISVDTDGFSAEMAKQKDRARSHVKDESWSTYHTLWTDIKEEIGTSKFVGHEQNQTTGTVVALVADDKKVESLELGQKASVVLDQTTFYGERGGQVGDTGFLVSHNGARFEVQDTQIKSDDLILHEGVVKEGTLSVGESVETQIDVMRRERIRRNHTATHILHWALRQVLGDHVKQAGSLVEDHRFRFDFTHFEAISEDQINEIEDLVNQKIFLGEQVIAYETSLENAREQGVVALFGEKYGEFVRVLETGTYSRELCGGTHVSNTSEIGLFKILSESSVGANVRRIEAITSLDALAYFKSILETVNELSVQLKTSPQDLLQRVEALQSEIVNLKQQVKKLKTQGNAFDVEELVSGAYDVGYPLVIASVEGLDGSELRELWDKVRQRLGEGAFIVASVTEKETPALLAAGTQQAIDAGFNANAVIKHIAPSIHGGGGGKPTLAQAGGKTSEGIPEALDKARNMFGVE